MKELDVMLNHYIDVGLEQLDEDQRQQFDALLNCQDTDLWYWLMGKSVPEEQSFIVLINNIRAANNPVK